MRSYICRILFAFSLFVSDAASVRAQSTAVLIPHSQASPKAAVDTITTERPTVTPNSPESAPRSPAPAVSGPKAEDINEQKPGTTISPLAASVPGPQQPPVDSSLDWANNYLLIPFAGAVFALVGALIYDRLKRRLAVRILSRHRRGTVDSLHGLYLQKIDPSERVSPRYVTHCLNTPATCIKSARALRRQSITQDLSASRHIVIAAESQGDVVGFLKAIYLPATSLLYIAYSAVQDGESALERRTMRKILEELRAFTIAPTPVRWVAFEIANVDPKLAKAKERLFRQYAELFGVQFRRVGIDYLQPDLDCIEINRNQELPSLLYLGAVGRAPNSIEVEDLRLIIENMLFGIYVPTWLIDRPDHEAPILSAYARSVADLVLTGAPSKVTLV